MMNSLVLGAALITLEHDFGLLQTTALGFGTGLGFALVNMAFAAIDTRLAVMDLPAAFRGLSIQLITLGIISMAFLGFTGLAN